jgi:hypothetical protein
MITTLLEWDLIFLTALIVMKYLWFIRDVPITLAAMMTAGIVVLVRGRTI